MAKITYAPGTSSPGIVARATKQIGDPFKIGYCLYWCLVNVFKVPGLGDFDHDGDADCMDYWRAAKARGTVVEETDAKKLPVGALAIWSGGSHGYGHAAVVVEPGIIASTDLPRRGTIGKVPATEPHRAWGHDLLGYVLVDGNGFTLMRDTPKPPAKPAPVKYQARAAVNVRKSFTTASDVLGVLKPATKITAEKVVTAGNRQWIVHRYQGKRAFSAAEFFTKL